MKLHILSSTALVLFSLFGLTACQEKADEASNTNTDNMIQPLDSLPTDNGKINTWIRSVDSSAQGQPGAWQFQTEGRTLVCFTDENADRMRIMTPVAEADPEDSEEMARCLLANFDRALDARYCVHDGQLWSAFLHPLSSLDQNLFHSAVRQVATLADNHGTSYSSGDLIFGGE